MYRVFEALDQLVTIVEEARGVPMTASCVVPRGDVLDLMDDVRDALPGEMDDAQDVLDHRDQMIEDARVSAETTVGSASTEAQRMVDAARAEASATVAGAKSQAQRTVDEAGARAEALLKRAHDDAERTIAAGQEQHSTLIERGHLEQDRLVASGRASYDRSVADGQAEQARLVSQSDVVQAARLEASDILDVATDETDRMRAECDSYVDARLASLEEILTKTLRTVGRGRTSLRSGSVADLRD